MSKNEYWFNHWKPRLERLSHICQNSDHAICCHPRRFSAKKRNLVGGSAAKPWRQSGEALLAANQEVRQHRLNARMTAKQGPVCVGDPPPTFGDRHLWTPWHGVRLPVITTQPFGHIVANGAFGRHHKGLCEPLYNDILDDRAHRLHNLLCSFIALNTPRYASTFNCEF